MVVVVGVGGDGGITLSVTHRWLISWTKVSGEVVGFVIVEFRIWKWNRLHLHLHFCHYLADSRIQGHLVSYRWAVKGLAQGPGGGCLVERGFKLSTSQQVFFFFSL